MFYQKTESFRTSKPFTREELRVIKACQKKNSLEEIVDKTELEQDQVLKIIDAFII